MKLRTRSAVLGIVVALFMVVSGCFSAATKEAQRAALDAMKSGDLQNALAHWEKGLAAHLAEGYEMQHPDGVQAAMCAAWLNIKLGDGKRAAEYAGRLAEVEPKSTGKYNWHQVNWEFYLVQARAFEESGERERAKGFYRQFLSESRIFESEITSAPTGMYSHSQLESSACLAVVYDVPGSVTKPCGQFAMGGAGPWGACNESRQAQWVSEAESTRQKIFQPILEHARKYLSSTDAPAAEPAKAETAVECRLNSDCPPAMSCKSGKCVVECREDRDCESGAKCDTERGQCVK